MKCFNIAKYQMPQTQKKMLVTRVEFNRLFGWDVTDSSLWLLKNYFVFTDCETRGGKIIYHVKQNEMFDIFDHLEADNGIDFSLTYDRPPIDADEYTYIISNEPQGCCCCIIV